MQRGKVAEAGQQPAVQNPDQWAFAAAEVNNENLREALKELEYKQ